MTVHGGRGILPRQASSVCKSSGISSSSLTAENLGKFLHVVGLSVLFCGIRITITPASEDFREDYMTFSSPVATAEFS